MNEFFLVLLFGFAGIGAYKTIVDCVKACRSLIKKIKEHKSLDGRNN